MKTILLRLVTATALCLTPIGAMASTVSGCSKQGDSSKTKAAVTSFDLTKVISGGTIRHHDEGHGIEATFSGESGVYLVRYPLPEVLSERDRVSLSFTISGWEEINYLAFGWRDRQGKFWHAKSTNPPQGAEIRESIHARSIAFKLTQGWGITPPDEVVASIEVFVKGTPGK